MTVKHLSNGDTKVQVSVPGGNWQLYVGVRCKLFPSQMLLRGSKAMEITAGEIGNVVHNLPTVAP